MFKLCKFLRLNGTSNTFLHSIHIIIIDYLDPKDAKLLSMPTNNHTPGEQLARPSHIVKSLDFVREKNGIDSQLSALLT